MSTGLILGVFLLVQLTNWLLLDLIFYLKGEETFSQWIIRRSKISKFFAWAVLIMILCVALILILHFETFTFVF